MRLSSLLIIIDAIQWFLCYARDARRHGAQLIVPMWRPSRFIIQTRSQIGLLCSWNRRLTSEIHFFYILDSNKKAIVNESTRVAEEWRKRQWWKSGLLRWPTSVSAQLCRWKQPFFFDVPSVKQTKSIRINVNNAQQSQKCTAEKNYMNFRIRSLSPTSAHLSWVNRERWGFFQCARLMISNWSCCLFCAVWLVCYQMLDCANMHFDWTTGYCESWSAMKRHERLMNTVENRIRLFSMILRRAKQL